MKIEELLAWETKLTGVTIDIIDQLAEEAVKKIIILDLFDEQRLSLHFKKYGLEYKQALRLRYHAQTNLFFLCHLLDKYKDITERTHREICDFFVQKKPDIRFFKDFATQYEARKERLLLVPRGGFKSSIDLADCAQWVICYPEITILILTGVYDLAKDFIKELSFHFCLEETGAVDGKKKKTYRPKTMLDGNPSWFQVLFPEHTITPVEMKDTEFFSPAAVRFGNKEVTARAASIEQNLSGWHYDIMKLDDVVTNENSLTIGRLEAVNKQINVNKAMLNPYGFFDKIGTWYHEADTYGRDMEYIERCKKDGEEWTIDVLLRAALWPTDEAVKAGLVEAEMKESDWVLWFPERLSYKFLMNEKKKDLESFAIKYMNDPKMAHHVKFPRELLVRRTIPQTLLPNSGMVVMTIDTAYSTKSWADFTVIIVALIYGGRFYVIDMVRGKFSEYELPNQIANTAFKWKPQRIVIEDSMGVRWLGRETAREMNKLQIKTAIEYESLGVGSSSKSKEIKAKPVARLLGDGRLFFSMGCNGLEELYKELEQFGNKEASHDDIVSGLSLLVSKFASYAEFESRVSEAEHYFDADPKERARYDLIHGLNRFRNYNANQLNQPGPLTVPEKEEPVTYVDPLADLL